ncbi:MAG: DUF167 domain-containing protein [Bauldia sp.]|nr:DUF167 domain-containing protein [Bauldia sp.]
MTALPWSAGADHLRLRVRLTPRAATDRIEGVALLSDGSAVLAARVRTAPEDNAANLALTRLVAAALDLPRSAVTIAAGHKARVKELRLAGDPAALTAAAARLWPAG